MNNATLEQISSTQSVSVRTKTAKTMTSAKAAWLKDRRSYLGATDAAAVLGVHPYRSPHDVWLEKNGLAEVEETVAMRHGTWVEAFIASEYQRTSGVKVRKSKLYRHPKFPQFACNPDREIIVDGRRGLLECKSVGHWASKNFGQDGSDQIPEHYLIQVMWQLMVTGAEFVHLAALIDTRELRVFTYTLNPELSEIAHVFPREMVQNVASHCGAWWKRHMVEGVEPPMSGLKSDTEYLQGQAGACAKGASTNTDEATDRECVKLGPALKRLARAELVVNERKNRIKKYMADERVDALESTVGYFTWKTNVKGVASFKHPFTGGNA